MFGAWPRQKRSTCWIYAVNRLGAAISSHNAATQSASEPCALLTSRTAPSTPGGGDVRAEAQERPRRVFVSMVGVRDTDAHHVGDTAGMELQIIGRKRWPCYDPALMSAPFNASTGAASRRVWAISFASARPVVTTASGRVPAGDAELPLGSEAGDQRGSPAFGGVPVQDGVLSAAGKTWKAAMVRKGSGDHTGASPSRYHEGMY